MKVFSRIVTSVLILFCFTAGCSNQYAATADNGTEISANAQALPSSDVVTGTDDPRITASPDTATNTGTPQATDSPTAHIVIDGKVLEIPAEMGTPYVKRKSYPNNFAPENYVMIPLRTVAEALHYTVSWDNNSRTATMTRGAYTLTAKEGAFYITDASGLIKCKVNYGCMIDPGTQRMMCALNVVPGALLCTLRWDADTNTAYITYVPQGDSMLPDTFDVSVESIESAGPPGSEGFSLTIGGEVPPLNKKHAYTVHCAALFQKNAENEKDSPSMSFKYEYQGNNAGEYYVYSNNGWKFNTTVPEAQGTKNWILWGRDYPLSAMNDVIGLKMDASAAIYDVNTGESKMYHFTFTIGKHGDNHKITAYADN